MHHTQQPSARKTSTGIRSLLTEIRNVSPGIRSTSCEIRNAPSGIQNPSPGIRSVSDRIPNQFSRRRYPGIRLLAFILLFTAAWSSVSAQVTMDLECEGDHLLPGTSCSLSFETDGLDDVQYLGLELRYDASRFEFVSSTPGSFFPDGAVYLAEHLPNGLLAASLSSTSGPRSGSGEMLSLNFVLRDGALSGHTSFTLEHFEVTDPDGLPHDITFHAHVPVTIPAYLVDAALTGPGEVTIAQGESRTFHFRLHAEGLQIPDVSAGIRLDASMGIIDPALIPGDPLTADPAAWDDAQWINMTHVANSEDPFLFEAVFPSDQPVGSWLAVGRFRLDDQPYFYAGYSELGGGIWDGLENTAVPVTVTIPRVTLAEWLFSREVLETETGVFANLPQGSHSSFSIAGARMSGWSTGKSGRAPNSNQWQPEMLNDEEEIEKYWKATLISTGYRHLNLTFSMTGSGTGPRDFSVWVRPDDGEWTAVPDGSVTSGVNWTTHELSLPQEAWDTETLSIRWMREGSASISGDQVSAAGTNRIDAVAVTGVPVDETEVTVWPGDADASGSVTEADVLRIAYYWMSRGPSRVPPMVNWAAQSVVRWLPNDAGFADTNGDGIVDYRDIMAIGRNFGKEILEKRNLASTEAENGEQETGEQSGLVLGETKAGDTLTVVLTLPASHFSDSSIQGFSFLAELEGSSAGNKDGQTGKRAVFLSPEPGFWSRDGLDSGRILSFHRSVGGTLAAAWGYKGPVQTEPELAGSINGQAGEQNPDIDMAIVRLYVLADLPENTRMIIRRAAFMDKKGNSQVVPDEQIRLTKLESGQEEKPPDEDEDEAYLPSATRLLPNYPNPFNATTVIPFEIHRAGLATLRIYDILGREVSTPVSGFHEAGRYQAVWRAEGYPSGLYLSRLEWENGQQVRQMMLIK